MKSLELSNFGVVEMNTKEMREVDGGKHPIWWFVEYAATKLVEEFLSNPQAFVSPNAHTTPYGHMGGARP